MKKITKGIFLRGIKHNLAVGKYSIARRRCGLSRLMFALIPIFTTRFRKNFNAHIENLFEENNMKFKWFFSTIVTALLITIALFGLASHDSIVAAQGESDKIEGALLDQFATDGSAVAVLCIDRVCHFLCIRAHAQTGLASSDDVDTRTLVRTGKQDRSL